MHARRLVAVPAVALAAVLFVGAVIDTGQRSRAREARVPVPVAEDPTVSAEQLRVAEALRAASACAGALECAPDRAASRLRGAARRIDAWPADGRYQAARDALQGQLETRAAVLDQRAAMGVDGTVSERERERLAQLDRAALGAARRSIDVQLAVGLLTREQHTQELGLLLRRDQAGSLR